ncbi:hypothetical protein CIK06_03460 [Plantactinospora sp. KBS50]|nr:hypothetical protein CIK06_03460 [Plantactinospora sp. KBS50]
MEPEHDLGAYHHGDLDTFVAVVNLVGAVVPALATFFTTWSSMRATKSAQGQDPTPVIQVEYSAGFGDDRWEQMSVRVPGSEPEHIEAVISQLNTMLARSQRPLPPDDDAA